MAGRNAAAESHVRAAFDAWEGLFADLFTRLRERSVLGSDADPAALATALLAGLEGGQLLSEVRRDSTPLRVAIKAARGHIRSFVA